MKNYILNLLKNLLHPAGIAGTVIALAIPFLIYLAPNIKHRETIRQLDLYLPLPLFGVQLLAGIILFCFLNKDFREWVKGILPEKSISIMVIVFTAVVTIFAGMQIEARHRVQSDESVFMSVAQNMYYNHESSTCNQGVFENGGLTCKSTSNSFKTKGLSFLYFLGMPLFGNNLRWIFTAEFLMLPLSILLMFLAIVAWTRQPLLAFLASLLMALQPTVLFQFRSMSVEPLYIFLSALSLLIFKWAYDRNTVMHWALLALVLGFFAQTRQETIFCLFAFILFALPRLLDKQDSKAPVFFVVLSLFSVPALLTISYFQGFGFQGGEFEAHGHFFEDLAKNWEVMTTKLGNNGELSNPFLSYFNYLFAIGAIYLAYRAINDARKKDFYYLKILGFLLLYHLQTYVILENVSGDFSIEINQRYSLVMLPSMAFVAALPMTHLVQYFATSKDKEQSATNVLVGILIVAVAFTGWTLHYKKDFNNNIMYNRNHLTIEEHEILGWLKTLPPADRFFIYGRPWHFVGYGISSIHYDNARQMKDSEMKDLIEKYKGEVYYIRGLDCWNSQTYHKKAVEHRIATTCDVFEREMDMTGVKNILVTNNYWVQIAKFNGRKNYNPEKIIKTGDIEAVPADSASKSTSLKIHYDLKEQGKAAANWVFMLFVNNSTVKKGAYNFGSYDQEIGAEQLQPGFNQVRFVVQDEATHSKLADVSKFYFEKANGAVALVDWPIESHQQGWGSMHKNESIDGNRFNVNGQHFDNGLGIHAASTTVFDIDKKYTTLKFSTGLDDESLCGNGVAVEVLGDGKSLAKTDFFQNGTLQDVVANVTGVKKLTIKTIPKEGIDCTHVDIINPVVVP
ncbi:MAG: NPCBM/NEW2 domain-containing protein [Fibrobacter sp.]|nr:NPCBM/NEW2 domain-containing protein [Fibrobacter sp.]